SLRVSTAGARALRTALRTPRLRAGTLGTLRIALSAPASAPSPAPVPVVVPTPTPTPTPVAVVPTTPAPPAAPAVPAPTVPTAPATPGVVVPTGVPSLDWTIRSSWLSYLAGGGGVVETSGGAARTTTGSYLFPTAGGSVDADGAGTVRYAGAVRFRQANHGIDMEFADFEIAFPGDGTAPRVTATFTNRNGDAAGAPVSGGQAGDGESERIAFGTLSLSEAKIRDEGDVRLVERASVLLSKAAADPFLFYKENDPFGAMSIRAAIAPTVSAP
ncbi:HtaA domain-containing protein, partial [Patulibacter sp. S7RM1-6]